MKAFVFLLLLLTPFSAAQAQYNPYGRPGKPDVVLDLSVLEDKGNAPEKVESVIILTPPAPPSVVATPVPPAPAPVLPSPRKRPVTASPAEDVPPPIATAPETVPEPPVMPAQKPLRKPDPEAAAAEPGGVEMPEIDVTEQILQAAAPLTEPAPEPMPEPAAEPVIAPVVAPPAAMPDTAAPVVPNLADLTIIFEGNAVELPAGARDKIDNATAQMKSMDSGRLQIRAYAAGEDGNKGSARRISLARALAVRTRMMDKGIDPARLDVRALGTETDRSPTDRVDLVFAR
jgi:outer membrane protein OmpA-like peptidoglycan-associated protein